MNLFGYVIEKYNPAQPGISADSGPAEPDNIIDYQRAYQEIEIINRARKSVV